MKLILFLLANAIALACGANLINYAWLIATFAIDYVRAIFSESGHVPNENFRNLSNEDFLKSETNIKMVTARNLMISAIFFGVGYAASALAWV